MSPAPTRAEIEADITLPTYQIEIDTGAGYVTVTSAEVISISGNLETTNNQDNAFAFGTIAIATAQFQTSDSYVVSNWQIAKVRFRFGFDTSDKIVAFEGIIIKRQHIGKKYQYECAGFDYIVSRKKLYTGVFFRRPIATKTTVSSLEDYTLPGARPGILNRLMFAVGGRPYEQPAYASDPDFKFWYSFDESIAKPRYAWISGEDAWEEAYRLVRAAGGQLYQDNDGVIYYKQPLSFGYVEVGSTLYEFTAETFRDITEDASTVEDLTTIKASFVERIIQPLQEVYNSSSAVLIPAGESVNIPLEMQYPVYQYAQNVTPQKILSSGTGVQSTFLDGRDASNASGFTVVINQQAASILDLTFTNAGVEPVAINKIVIEGRPITPGSERTASYSSGEGTELMLEDNVYIQSFAQAYRLVRMFWDFYHTNRGIVTLHGVPYDPDRYLGEVVEITYSAWSLDHAEHRIIGIDYSNGAKMNVRLAPIEGLITRDDVFIVNQTYTNTTVKLIAY